MEALLLVQYIIDHPHINRITVIDGLESKPLSLFFKFELEKNKNLKLKGLNDLQESQDQTLI